VSAGHFYICYSVQQTLFHIAISIKYCPGGHFNLGHYYVLQLQTFVRLLTVVLSLLRLTTSDYLFGIFKPFLKQALQKYILNGHLHESCIFIDLIDITVNRAEFQQ